MKTWHTGLIIGKLYPPHRGHRFLIESALAQVEQLHIILCEHLDEVPNGPTRTAWLREMFPTAHIMMIEDDYDQDDSALWAQLTIGWLGRAPDVVFTSEHYGEPYTHYLGCEHVCVDLDRLSVPISGTKVRADPLGNWDYIDPPLREYYAKRVVILGAESTGTTTLAQGLAEHFQTTWVAEYGREYCEQHWTGDDYVWRSEEFVQIASEQARLENAAARICNKMLICDTDAFVTSVWHWRYMNYFSPEVEQVVRDHKRPDLYLLTGDEIPFVQDGWRDGEAIRHGMHEKFEEELAKRGVPWQLVRGTQEERLGAAIAHIETLLATTS